MKSLKHDTDYRLQLAIEDRFAIIKLHQPDALLPSEDIVRAFDLALKDLPAHYTVICDLRGIPPDGQYREPTNDALDLVRAITTDVFCLATSEEINSLRLSKDIKLLQINNEAPIPNYKNLDLEPLALRHGISENALRPYQALFEDELPTREEYEFACKVSFLKEIFKSYEDCVSHWDATISEHRVSETTPGAPEIVARRFLQQFTTRAARNSLLVEFGIQFANDKVCVVPYHSHAINKIAVGDELWLARPGVIARNTRSHECPVKDRATFC
jgi:hypothetical protein